MDAFCEQVRRLAEWLSIEPALPLAFAEPGFRQDLETVPQPFLELYLVTEGTLRLTVKEHSQVLRAGDLALANAHFGNFGREVQGAFRYGCLSIELPSPPPVPAWTMAPFLLWRRALDPARLQSLFQEVSHAYHEAPYPLRDIQLKGAFLQLLAAAGDLGGRPRGAGGTQNPHVRKAVELMAERRGDPDLTLPWLGKRVGISPSHLVRLFQNHLGKSPMRHLTELRVRHAQSLLARSNLSIKEISYLVGFRDQLYFSRVFRQETGTSPRAFRSRA
jgi:AraC-like DNA-binding protein